MMTARRWDMPNQNINQWICLPVFLFLAFLSVGCEGRVGTPYFKIDRALPCESTSFELAILYDAGDNSSNLFSKEFWDLWGEGPLCLAHPTISPPSTDCYFFYSKSTRSSDQGVLINCTEGNLNYRNSWQRKYHYRGYVPEDFIDRDLDFIAHLISCTTADPIRGQVVYAVPTFDTSYWDVPEVWMAYAPIKIPSQIIIDDIQVVWNERLFTNVATFSGHLAQADGGPCPGWEDPYGWLVYEVAGERWAGHASPEFTVSAFVPLSAGIYSYDFHYDGNQFYLPSDISGTVRPTICHEPFTNLTFHRIGTVLATLEFPVGVTLGGRAYDPGSCAPQDLSEGSVTLTTDEGTTCPITVLDGVGRCERLAFQTAGTHSITASYDGGGIFEDTAATIEVIVEKISSETQIVSHDPDPVKVGQQLEVNVQVSGPGPTPTGEVQINAGGGSCVVALVDGQGSCTLTPVIAGATTITAEYEGDDTYHPSSTDSSATVQPLKQTTVTNIEIDDRYGGCVEPKPIQVTVQVSGVGGTPTGTVSITGADVSNCQITLYNGGGTCILWFSSMNHENRPVYATYSGDANFLGSSATGTFMSCQ
jgi:hypothetical protein